MLMKILFLTVAFIGLLSLQSCGDDDLNTLEEANRNVACFQDEGREVVEILTDIDAFVIKPSVNNCNGIRDNQNYTLSKGENDVRQLLPCSLNNDFKTDQDSLSVIYSGYLYESFGNEIICAQKFEITSINLTHASLQ